MFPAASPDSTPIAPSDGRLESLLALGVVLVYCALQIILFAGHDPWLDEAQAWLWATSISRPIDFLILPNEGHPPLWYWVLRGLSLFLDFNQARYLSLLIALGNAFLLWRLLGRDVPVLFAMLGSFIILQFWGYHFRPYNIVFSCVLGALLLDRQGKGIAATWLLAVACGFHFFAGMLFAFWLVYQRTRGAALVALLGPALLALAFGGLALLSGLGNAAIGPATPDLLVGTLHNLSWIGMIAPVRGLWLALATLAIIIVALYRQPVILLTVLGLLLAFAFGTATIYGKYPWHSAFMTMLCFMAIMVAGLKGRRWALLALLLPQVLFGAAGVSYRLTNAAWSQPDLYAVIRDDASPGFEPSRQLVAWPDLVGVAMAAEEDISVVSGNDGSLLGPIDWRNRNPGFIDPALAARPTPWWLICGESCQRLLDHLDEHGRSATFLAGKTNADNGEFSVYRID